MLGIVQRFARATPDFSKIGKGSGRWEAWCFANSKMFMAASFISVKNGASSKNPGIPLIEAYSGGLHCTKRDKESATAGDATVNRACR
ncbi:MULTISPECIES: hypothetical protein [unclassified Bradyrhizobium]|uniref:hypothetical protein n=1 Tax=unclassified Bradyrhizobium TaxID=2631580 RepID=UPI0024798D51|nr:MULTISPECIES: hypothetical protein [unclassified Bradyrhizobium]WGR70569.1 hypothetical protein MTX24_35465 [Bradyrhizobium sp. ISRA426]WGR75406.1 hypothetical protein MTX21_20565 [Bradyrhizobium sp. ISRA430]WGR85809.1 hypothetical protein MTX25_35150 [Bradyrhizobium sp. ISRA432]